eukprot:COSAG05_NODE_1578_length_4501_cov_2.007269_6_plen_66_part_00
MSPAWLLAAEREAARLESLLAHHELACTISLGTVACAVYLLIQWYVVAVLEDAWEGGGEEGATLG